MSDSSTSQATLALTKELIAAQSVTPHDAGCQNLMAKRLEACGFSIERLDFDDDNGAVKNFWARRGSAKPCLAFAGHTDVVPTGDLELWHSPPFEPTERDEHLFGRGAADMKTSLAAFITSIENFVEEHPDHDGSIALLITSDEEGPATCGTVKVIEVLESRQEKIDYCLVGEPSSTSTLGDIIKNGRRGSVGCELTIIGTQGHVAYPHLADNPIHYCGDVINTLKSIEWDNGNEYFPPTSFQISNIVGGTGATNVIPETVKITFNLRYSTEITADGIQTIVADALNELGQATGLKFTSKQLSTTGGTSDGRFIAPTGAQVVELGPINATIHKVNECVALETPEKLSKVYQGIMENLLT